jgi:hypothetical protein
VAPHQEHGQGDLGRAEAESKRMDPAPELPGTEVVLPGQDVLDVQEGEAQRGQGEAVAEQEEGAAVLGHGQREAEDAGQAEHEVGDWETGGEETGDRGGAEGDIQVSKKKKKKIYFDSAPRVS